MFIVQYDGRRSERDKIPPAAYASLDKALAALKAAYTDDDQTEAMPPDLERDRIVIWQARPDAEESMVVVWAYIGWNWRREGLPGIEQTNDDLPGIGSLQAYASRLQREAEDAFDRE